MSVPIHPEWRWLLREMRPVVRPQAASLACIVSASAADLTGPLLMKWVIDDVLPNGRWGALALATLGLWLASVGRASLSALGMFLNAFGVRRMTVGLRVRLTRHVQRLPAEFHAKRALGDLVQRLERDVACVGELGSDILPSMIQTAISVAMTVAVMVYLDWRISAVVLPLVPAFAYLRHRYHRRLLREAEGVREAAGRESNLLHEILTGAVELQLLGAESRLARRYLRLSLGTMRRQLVQRRLELLFKLAMVGLIALGAALVVGFGGARVLLGGMTAGSLIAFYAYVNALFPPLNMAVDVYSRVHRVIASIRRLMDLEAVPGEIRDAPDAEQLSEAPRQLVCRNVSFTYGADRSVLSGVDFAAGMGERIVIIGQSGCGKSSLLKLIPRLYDPSGGHLQLDGRDMRSLQLRSLRQWVSFVPQEPILFQGTLRENLRYAQPTATAEEIAEAAWMACLTDVIQRLPRGLDTDLGHMGAALSGGEKQRFAIARALLQKRPILILDESSSALDGRTEHELLKRLQRWAAGRLIIFASHRMAAVHWADRVIVLNQGRVVEHGTPDTLDRQGTHYAALWQYHGSADSRRC
jgi:ABC-type multidrug transport system fused ATPase/permease subunit